MKINWAPPLLIIVGAVMLWLLLDKPNPSPSSPSSTTAVATPVHIPSEKSTGANYNSHASEHSEGINQDDSLGSTPAHDGQEKPDYTHSTADQQAALDVTARFITGWLDPDPTARRTALEPIAAGDLVTQLSSPDIRIWQTTIQGPPTITHQNTTTVTTQQTFSDGRAVVMLLLYDPTIETRWTVIDIQAVKEN